MIVDTFLVLYVCERRRLWIRLSIGDIAQAQYVADALVPLPRIVPMKGCDGQRINESFIAPQYISVATIQRCQYKAKVNIKRDTRESVPFGSGKKLLLFHFRHRRPARILLNSVVNMVEPIHTPVHKMYERYYLNETRLKRGSLPAFQVACFQRGCGLGSIFGRLFRCTTPHLKQYWVKKHYRQTWRLLKICWKENTLKRRHQSVLNKLCQVVTEKRLKGKHIPVQPSVQLRPRHGKQLVGNNRKPIRKPFFISWNGFRASWLYRLYENRTWSFHIPFPVRKRPPLI